ncbi:MAG: hypothetical protein R3A47_01160 [Polyangiales bacterium]
MHRCWRQLWGFFAVLAIATPAAAHPHGPCDYRDEGDPCFNGVDYGTCRGTGTLTCCTGCWNGVDTCSAGNEVSQCGDGGALCVACNDGNECTADSCENNECISNALLIGTECSGGYCTGLDPFPACVGCVADSQCDDGNECTENQCENFVCAYVSHASGTSCATGVCDGAPSAPECVECVSDAQCGGGEAYCLFDANLCVGCLTGADCDDGNECTTDTCMMHACVSDPSPKGSECSTGVCDGAPSAPECVACVSDAQCDGDAPHCSLADHQCVVCTDASQCDDGNECTENRCTDNVCEFVALEAHAACSAGICDGNVVESECVQCLGHDDCAVDEVCVDNLCMPAEISVGGAGPLCAMNTSPAAGDLTWAWTLFLGFAGIMRRRLAQKKRLR